MREDKSTANAISSHISSGRWHEPALCHNPGILAHRDSARDAPETHVILVAVDHFKTIQPTGPKSQMKMSVLDEIKVLFGPFLREHDFRSVEMRVSDSFGDAFEIFDSEDLRLRFVSDRGRPFVEIMSKKGQSRWIDLNLLRAVVLGVPVSSLGTEEQVSFLINSYSLVREALDPRGIENTLRKLKKSPE